MKYTIESTETGCVETIEMKNGKTYTRTHERMPWGSQCKDKDFSEQMEQDGVCDEMLNNVYDTFDSFLASNFMDIARLEGEV